MGIATNLETKASEMWNALSCWIEKGIARVHVQIDSLEIKHMLNGVWKVPCALVELAEKT